MNQEKTHNFILLSIIIFVITIGCATTNTPNYSAINRVPSLTNKPQQFSVKSKSQTQYALPLSAQNLFFELYKKDPVVALEIGKLPEYQGQIGDLQVRSLSRFLDILIAASTEEKSNLRKFLEVGKPEYRRYCSPLQAIFWLLEKEEYNSKISPLTYSLDTLLKNSWNFHERDRWKDYEVVTDRLNAPELIIFYEIRQFNYEFRRDPNGNPYTLFKTKTGHCIDTAEFTVYCLRKNGYDASTYKVVTSDPWPHVTTLAVIDGNRFIVDNWPFGIVPLSQYKRE